MPFAMIHLPINENAANQFAARFVPTPQGGFVYFHNDTTDGIPVSAAEAETLIANHARALGQSKRIMIWWLVAGIVLMGILYVPTDRDPPLWQAVPAFSGGVVFAMWLRWRAERAPLELAGRRVAVARARGLGVGARVRLAALPLSVPLMMIGVGVLLLVQLWRLEQFRGDPLTGVIGVFVVVFGIVILAIRPPDLR